MSQYSRRYHNPDSEITGALCSILDQDVSIMIEHDEDALSNEYLNRAPRDCPILLGQVGEVSIAACIECPNSIIEIDWIEY